ncbi:WSCD family member CG9164 [Anastrepha ludens]|uniref:WSCD family member CG9164 n=1 Tax=Anastrepha ludens TaxID=28586 RepID=UPI0023AEB005|nr:WSCD family member CG9164 [Anastrepha ludens]
MVLQSWRLFGVSVTIIIYICSVLFLSMNSTPRSNQRNGQAERFAEFANFRNTRFRGFTSRTNIRWCNGLKYLKTNLPDNMITIISTLGTNKAGTTETSKSETEYRVPGLTALASFPGSGNTWLRYLLQQATGILTGSVYKDYGLLKTGFPAENIRNNSVLLVKTHEFGPNAWEPFTKAILLVRDPEKAILAEFNRQSGGHIGFASPDRYKRTRGKYWTQFVLKSLKMWEATNLSWARDFPGNVKVVFYEDLVGDLEKTLRGVLNYIEFPINESLLSCALTRREGVFRRKKRFLNFDPFTLSMRSIIKQKKLSVYKYLEKLK